MFNNEKKTECIKALAWCCEFCELGYECNDMNCENYKEYAKGLQTYHVGNIGSALISILPINIDMLIKQLKIACAWQKNRENSGFPDYSKWLNQFFCFKYQTSDLSWTILNIAHVLYTPFMLFAFPYDMFHDKSKRKHNEILNNKLENSFRVFRCVKRYISECIIDTSFYDIEKFYFAEKYFFNIDSKLEHGLDLIDLKYNLSFYGAHIRGNDEYRNADNFISDLNKLYSSSRINTNTEYECYDEIYEVESLELFTQISLRKILESGLKFKTCQNCDIPFIPYNRSDMVYCDRISPQDNTKTCREYGARQSYKENLSKNKAMGLYRKIYMAKQNLANRHPDILSYLQSFENYKIQAKQWKQDVKEGKKTETEYIEWLKAVKEKKV